MAAAGRITVTFTSEATGEHITVTAKSRKNVDGKWVGCPLAEAMVVFFSVPQAGGGWDDKIGKATRGKGFVPAPGADPARVFCAKKLIAFIGGADMPAGLTAQESECCGKCGRALTDPVSIDRGIGPECFGQLTGSKHETKKKGAVTHTAPEDEPAVRVPGTDVMVTKTGETRPMNDEEKADFGVTAKPVTRKYATTFAGKGAEQAKADTAAKAASDGKDKLGVAYGHGDWKARKAMVAERQKADGVESSAPEVSSQNAVFPETGDCIPY